MNFRNLGLIPPIQKALLQQGYLNPTPIQEQAIGPALQGRDILGLAQTGTGKTCAFGAPILQTLTARMRPEGFPIRALILTPTRELAIQIDESLAAYGRNLKLRHTVIFGGVSQKPQVEALKNGIDILTATPGRLLDLQGQGLVDLTSVEIFVLDEADRMLDMGFIHDVRKVLKLLPEKKQTMLFSATMPKEIEELAGKLLHDPVRVAVDPVSSPVERIKQTLYFVDKGNKTKLLAHLMETGQISSALVFTRTKHGANKVAADLIKNNISAAAIHGNKSQTARQQALGDFKDGKLRVLVATDIAARGIDIEELPCVFNYNLPEVPETYVHRIGRTGRAGKEGIAIAFCDFAEKPLLKEVEKLIGKQIPVVKDHPYPMQDFSLPEKDKKGRVINAEDAEARQAAKERKKENKRVEKDVPSVLPVETKELPQEPAEEKRSRRKRKAKEKKAIRPEIIAEKTETAPVEGFRTEIHREQKKLSNTYAEPAQKKAEPSDIRRQLDALLGTSEQEPEKKTGNAKRGVRQQRLQDSLPKQPSVANSEFSKPDPLSFDRIMDATARLLAPKPLTLSRQTEKENDFREKADRPQKKEPAEKTPEIAGKQKKLNTVTPLEKKKQENQPVTPKKEKPENTSAVSKKKKKKKATAAPVQKQVEIVEAKAKEKEEKAAPITERKTKKKKKGTAAKKPAPQMTAKPEQAKKPEVHPEPQKETQNRKKESAKRRHDRTSERKNNRVKDSTEQKSLMKPFYMEH